MIITYTPEAIAEMNRRAAEHERARDSERARLVELAVDDVLERLRQAETDDDVEECP